ncbi:hypothetical protein BASA81_014818 [Batrachochytrium salamandrivorans]|nr:hypothetical protein BASA81_014818 [Batrachochytrium salamandrivorans]
MALQKTLDSIPDLTGKTVVVTGATMGLGFYSAGVFASKGARVLVHGRTLEKATNACQALSLKTGSSLLEPIYDGIESCMAVNHLAHYYLFRKLEVKLKMSKARIVSVSSAVAHTSHKDGIPDTLKGWNSKDAYMPMYTYGDSKLANVLFTQYVADHYASSGIVATVVDPGVVSTGLHAKATGPGIYPLFLRNVSWLFASSPELGVLTQVVAAVSPAVLSGSAWKLVDSSWDISMLTIDDRAERLWKTSEDILVKKGFL